MRSPLTAKKLTVIDIFAEHYRMFAKENYPTLANMAATELVFRMSKGAVLHKKYSLSSVFRRYYFRYLLLVLWMPPKHLQAKYKLVYLTYILPFSFLHRIYRKHIQVINFNDESNL